MAKIDGISKKLIEKNRDVLKAGNCQGTQQVNLSVSSLKDVFLNPVNIVFVIFILILAIIDIRSKKDFKSQIVSVGVLGTFVGIFIGLQNFDPQDIINSVNDILTGLKTAFFTSIVGMSIATLLSIFEKLKEESEDK